MYREKCCPETTQGLPGKQSNNWMQLFQKIDFLSNDN